MRALLALLCLVVACTDAPAITDDTDTVEAVEDTLRRYLTGTFDSSAQSVSDPAYFDIRMVLCDVDTPSLGERVLYLEQAQAEDLQNPYRQRLYVIEAGEDESSAISRIFTIPNEAGAVGACEDASRLPSAQGATEKVGCAVSLEWDGSAFSGGTVGTDCPTALGGDYASSEVTLSADQLTSWDRGFNADGSQEWGATAGPYIFDRKTDIPAE